MIILSYFIFISFVVFAIGLAGILASRHFLIMMLSVEIAISASTIFAVSIFYFAESSSTILPLLLAIWSVASAEVMAIIVFYRYMVGNEVNLDVTKLRKLKN
jgi:NADH:ubiquinone oxidoreductase subunit K